ncbi:hypothetical protein ACFVUY_27025 [Kitasatospora sp. NPDC058063]|uniref:hypothetical protein n=1 Tax=unclassified Kitasatospora TaxID=2633591 RepID=UPI0036DDD6BC
MNEPDVRISLERLREALDVLVRHVAAGVPAGEIAIQQDAFWSVPVASMADVYSGPPELTIGMVSESWSHVEEMIDDEDKVVGYGLVWLADVLRAIGSKVV